MKRTTGWIATLLASSMLLSAGSATAITNGEADDGRHPYVGALVSYDKKGKFVICTGTLVSPSVFMTAAHCLVDEPSDLYVSFDAFVGAPQVGPDVILHHGEALAHPRFEDETAPGNTYDIAVVVLDEPIEDIVPAQLARRGMLDRLEEQGRPESYDYVSVGYGREGSRKKKFFGGGTRRFAASRWLSLEPHKLHLDQRGDLGGSCRGDSGGPVLFGTSAIVLGIISDGDPLCTESSVNYRVDTRSAQAFVKGAIEDAG